MPDKPRNAIIVGMARSGTSLTASIFARQGYFIADDTGSDTQQADLHNPGGYWELDELVEANARVLAATGFPDHNTWTSRRITPEQARAVKSLVHSEEHVRLVERFAGRQPWMWKDPRLCYTLDYWWPLMDPATTGVVLVTRDPIEIHRSLVRANWGGVRNFDVDDYIDRINQHIANARESITRLDIPHIEFDYSDYARHPERIADALNQFFGFRLSPDDLGFKAKYNTSGVRGRIAFALERVGSRLPAPVRQTARKLIPRAVLRTLWPNRPELH